MSTSSSLHGEWPSPISADLAAAASGGITWPSVHGDQTWWCASDPATSTVGLHRCAGDGEPERVLGPEFGVGNRSLGYGGRPYVVLDGAVVVTRSSDQRLYRIGTVGDPVPVPLTPPDVDGWVTSYADPVPGRSAAGAEEVWCVRERQRPPHGPEDADPAPRTARAIVAVPLDGSGADEPDRVRVVATSHHFLSGARPSPDGRRLAWIGWDHPAMPWDGTELMVADVVDGVATSARPVLGGSDVSVAQVEWDGSDALYAMADPEGWWNLHRITLDPHEVTCVLPVPRDCASAIWRVGPTWFAVTSAGVALVESENGDQRLRLWSPKTGEVRDLAPGWTDFNGDLKASAPEDPEPVVAVVAASATRPSAVVRVPVAPGAAGQALTEQRSLTTLAPYVPVGERRTAVGVGGRDVHYVYFPPTHPHHDASPSSRPPLLVHVHGGPTSSTTARPDLEHAFFTSRGFAVASVDYGGSTGYGREYRNRLRHSWGIVDVEDSVAVAAELARLGLADPARTAIRGGSAGGWTALAALATTDTFCAGAVYYPISDPANWSRGSTHDFESRYIESLVGELPRDRVRYERVSPLANAAGITSPLVLLQGRDDTICPPVQAERVVEVVSANGVWHRYLTFEGEGHGFRKERSVADSLRAEAELYSRTMGITVDPDAR
ncbi:alpha/beta hydrolase family protein [Nocardioides sp. MAHUQ-72]|uniref:alpha/beta hydrolase family protein n=1 Tax=unclassified Nocardioides TaxID=2615069 RepID=UPI003617DEBC